MYIWTQVVLFVMLAVLTLPALGAMAKWPGLHDGTIDKELAYGMLLGHYLPTGLLGLALVAMFASIMSTVDSNMNFGAQVFINDVYRRSINPNASMKHYMRLGKVVMFVIMGLALLVATRAKNVIDISVFMLGLSSAELTANWGQWWWWRFNGPARLTASFGGPLIFLANKYIVFRYVIDAGADATYLIVLGSIAVTCALWIIVALLTKPDAEETLIAFYRRTRPMGLWGPIARKANLEPTAERVLPQTPEAVSTLDDAREGVDDSAGFAPVWRGLVVALLGAVTVGSGTIGFSCLYVARWGVAAVAAGCALIAGVLFRFAYVKYMQDLGADPNDELEE